MDAQQEEELLTAIIARKGGSEVVRVPRWPEALRGRLCAAKWKQDGQAPVFHFSIYGKVNPGQADKATLNQGIEACLCYLAEQGDTPALLGAI